MKSKTNLIYTNNVDVEVCQNEHGYIFVCKPDGDIPEYDLAWLTDDESIAAARAILKHFGEGLE